MTHKQIKVHFIVIIFDRKVVGRIAPCGGEGGRLNEEGGVYLMEPFCLINMPPRHTLVMSVLQGVRFDCVLFCLFPSFSRPG